MVTAKDIDGFFVYKYVAKDGRIVYIGKSKAILQRIKTHGRYLGIDEKFKKYEDADIYIHKCASEHEMDALETILIESHKPELNVSCKTDEPLSFAFEPKIEWVDFKEVERKHREKAKKERNAKMSNMVSKAKKEKPSAYVIRSDKKWGEFMEKIFHWHSLYYFVQWLSEQDDDDKRATIELDISDNEIDKWMLSFDKKGALRSIDLPVLSWSGGYRYGSGTMGLVLNVIREGDHLWIDLYSQVCRLKKIIPAMKWDLEKTWCEISKYTVADEYVHQMIENDVDWFFEKVGYGEAFPRPYLESQISAEENEKCYEMLSGRYLDIPSEMYTSPEIDWSGLSEKEKWGIWLNLIRGCRHTDYLLPGGAYWNIWGIGKLSEQLKVARETA